MQQIRSRTATGVRSAVPELEPWIDSHRGLRFQLETVWSTSSSTWRRDAISLTSSGGNSLTAFSRPASFYAFFFSSWFSISRTPCTVSSPLASSPRRDPNVDCAQNRNRNRKSGSGVQDGGNETFSNGHRVAVLFWFRDGQIRARFRYHGEIAGRRFRCFIPRKSHSGDGRKPREELTEKTTH